jgi:hypothetical protein
MRMLRTLVLAGLILGSGCAAMASSPQEGMADPPAPSVGESPLAVADRPFPNVISSGMFRIHVTTSAPVVFFVTIKLYGVDVWESPRQSLESGFDGTLIYRIDRTLSPGQYQLVPYVITPKGELLRAKIDSSRSYDSYPVLIP